MSKVDQVCYLEEWLDYANKYKHGQMGTEIEILSRIYLIV